MIVPVATPKSYEKWQNGHYQAFPKFRFSRKKRTFFYLQPYKNCTKTALLVSGDGVGGSGDGLREAILGQPLRGFPNICFRLLWVQCEEKADLGRKEERPGAAKVAVRGAVSWGQRFCRWYSHSFFILTRFTKRSYDRVVWAIFGTFFASFQQRWVSGSELVQLGWFYRNPWLPCE